MNTTVCEWSIFDFTNKGYLSTKDDFKRQFVMPIEKLEDEETLEELKTIAKPFVMRRLKTDEEIKKYIDLAVKRSIKEYKRSGMLKGSDNAIYTDIAELLANYYKNGQAEANITYAIQGQRFDPYYLIIPLYYGEGKTIESIAEKLGVDVSTVVRNKKRLCLAIYNEII